MIGVAADVSPLHLILRDAIGKANSDPIEWLHPIPRQVGADSRRLLRFNLSPYEYTPALAHVP